MAADAHLAARCHFFLLGVAILLPWNSFITAVDYFGALFPGQHLDRVFSVAYMAVNIASISANLRYQAHATAPARVAAGLAGYVAALLAVPIADGLVSAGLLSLGGYKAVLVGALVAASFCDGVVQPAVFGEAAELPLACVQAVTAGTAASGVIVTGLRIVAKAAGGETFASKRAATIAYFLVTILICIATLALYWLHLRRLPVYIEHTKAAAAARAEEHTTPHVRGDAELLLHSPRAPPHAPSDRELIAASEFAGASLDAPAAIPPLAKPPRKWPSVLRRIARPAAAVFVVYTVTLSIFPGFLSEDVTWPRLGSWYVVLLFFTFTLLDFASRWWPVPERLCLGASVARVLLYPAFAWCSLGAAPPLVVFALTAALGATNGALTTAAFVAASREAGPAAADTAGLLMVFALMLGLLAGSTVSWLWLLV